MTHPTLFDFRAKFPPASVVRAGLGLPDPRAAGEAAGAACAARADRGGFDTAGAAECVLAWLRTHGETSGEFLTNMAKGCGFVPHDDRAYGPVFSSLARRGLIRVVGHVPRERGHGASGGRVWKIVDNVVAG